jgi:hypothetical protein
VVKRRGCIHKRIRAREPRLEREHTFGLCCVAIKPPEYQPRARAHGVDLIRTWGFQKFNENCGACVGMPCDLNGNGSRLQRTGSPR